MLAISFWPWANQQGDSSACCMMKHGELITATPCVSFAGLRRLWGYSPFADVFADGLTNLQGDEGTFTFLETVLKEVLELFPSQHIHIGGDEVGNSLPP